VRASRHAGIGVWAAATLTVAACHRSTAPASDTPPPVDVPVANIVIVDSALVESGPSLSGTLAARHTATLRAQVAGDLLDVYVDEGTRVDSAERVALIDTLTLAQAARSAQSQLTSAKLAADVAQRNYQRSVTLHDAGAIADRDLETAHDQAVAAQAAADEAASRLASAQKQLDNATVRAPFGGVVSSRVAHAGDVLQIGNPIMTIIEPGALQLDAAVPADYLRDTRVGTPVEFSVNGDSAHTFDGRISRVNPSVDSVTRQVEIHVTVPNDDRALAAGLFAQGRVVVESVHGLAIPLTALDPRSSVPQVRRVHGGTVEIVPVTLGIRDDLAERVQVTDGLSLGDTLLVGASIETPPGSTVHITHPDR
jgi:RND family efflux transporter MFP subunit